MDQIGRRYDIVSNEPNALLQAQVFTNMHSSTACIASTNLDWEFIHYARPSARFRSGSRRLSRLTRSGSMMYPKPSPSSSTSAVRRWSASAPGPGNKFEGQCLEQHARTFCDRRDSSSHHHVAGCLLQQALYPRGPGHNFEGQCLEQHARTFCNRRDGSSHHHFL